jgi:hypothetical protein
MTRPRVAMIAAVASLSLGTIAIPVAQANNGTTVPPSVNTLPPLDTVHVTGTAKNGKQFSGSFAIQRFVAGQNAVYAVGTLKGMLAGRHVTRYGVRIPVNNSSAITAGGAARDTRARAAQACQILHLVLGPLDLNLLGLRVQLNQVVLDITAVPGAGNLLGNLLCDVTNALNPGALSALTSNLSQIAALLNSLTGLLGSL